MPQLKGACAELPFLLCGPPGCGKKSALRMALRGQQVNQYDLSSISNEKGTKLDLLEQLLRKNLGGQQVLGQEGDLKPCTLILYGVEHLGQECAELLREKPVVLVGNDRNKHLRYFRVTWMKRHTEQELIEFLQRRFPQVDRSYAIDIAKLCDGDLRQATIQMELARPRVKSN